MVLVSHTHEFVFLKTHKTASTSAEGALEHLCLPAPAPGTPPYEPHHERPAQISPAGIVGARGRYAQGLRIWRNHMPAWQVRLALGREKWRRYLKIATVRNPYDRAVSLFFQRGHFKNRDWVNTASEAELTRAFREWLPTEDLTANLNKLRLRGQGCIDHFIYYETLGPSLEELRQRFGNLPAGAVPTFKAGRRKSARPYQDFYDDTSRALVADANAYEIDLLGYTFDGGPAPRAAGVNPPPRIG